MTDRSRGVFAVDSTAPGAAPRGFDAFRHEWQTQIGDVFPLPAFSPATIADFRIKGRVARVRDVVIADLHLASATRIADPRGGDQDLVEIHLLRRGAWTLGGLPERYEYTVPTGQFLLRHFGRQMPFETAPHTTAQFLFLPSAMLRPLIGNRTVIGSADSAEMRLLTAHTNMIQQTATDLSPAGVRAAHSTLQRAFATVGESVTAYIRHRRLEEARLALTAPSGRWSVSELAAYWHFADSSHFIRAFKKHYGQTPTEYARSIGSTPR